MSDLIDSLVQAISSRLSGGFDGSAKVVITGEGAIMIDEAGVRAGDEAADVTLSADAETFQSMMAGDLDPMSAVGSGRLSFDGDMGTAMRLGSALS